MTAEVEAHETTISMVAAPPAEVRGASDIALKVQVSCPSGCDLWGRTVRIVTPDGETATEAALVSSDGTSIETDEFLVRVPSEPGDYTYAAVFPAQERKCIRHEESSIPFSFIVLDHATSVEVWDVPPRVVPGHEFRIKAGVKCSSECNLAGQMIEIYDHTGEQVAAGTLGEVPWPDAPGLYWVEVKLQAPTTEGRHRWRVRLPALDLDHHHEEVFHTFVIVTARKAEHVVTIEVVAPESQAPIKNARLRLRPRRYTGSMYMTHTDEDGVATLNAPGGDYQLYVWGEQYEKIVQRVNVDGDLAIRVELSDPLGSWRQFRS